MIPVSMSRKDASFSQLVNYMQDAEKSERDYDLHHHCMSRGRSNIADEFLANSQHLPKHKSRNTLYHEIISITLEEGVELKHAKDCLRDIAQTWIDMRCPRNMVYGCLHEDHQNHLHYHLMVSANELGQSNRLRLTKAEFETVKHDLEAHVLKNYPELKQKAINTLSKKERSESRKANAQKSRTGKLDRREQVKATITEAMMHTTSHEEFVRKLSDQDFEFYTRGKNFGVKDLKAEKKPDTFRFSTLGIHDSYEEFASLMQSASQARAEPKEDFREQAPPKDAESPHSEEQQAPREEDTQEQSHAAFEETVSPDVSQDKHDLRSSKTQKTDFQRDMERRVHPNKGTKSTTGFNYA